MKWVISLTIIQHTSHNSYLYFGSFLLTELLYLSQICKQSH